MPAYNEEETILSVVDEWYKVVEKISLDSRLVVINDGSKDKTYEILCRIKEKYPQLKPITKDNEGHGATVLWGYQYALQNNADYIFQTDSDGQTLSSEFWDFWRLRNKYKAIIGHRNHRQDGLSRLFVTKTLKLVVRLIFGLNITDANTPFRLLESKCLSKYIRQIPDKYNLSNVLLTVLLVKNEEDVKFMPITFKPRQGGVNFINLKRICIIGIQAVNDFSNIKKHI
jgi:glycosyltransferase involved in cell wall biosynthesis